MSCIKGRVVVDQEQLRQYIQKEVELEARIALVEKCAWQLWRSYPWWKRAWLTVAGWWERYILRRREDW